MEFNASITNEEKSKTQRKREMLELQSLAAELCALSKERLISLPLSDTLRDALAEMGRVRSHEGKRRQMQYLGKLMRYLDDHSIAAIRIEIEKWQGNNKAYTDELHHLERLRASLIADDAAMTRLLNDHPHADIQVLRTLVRNARKELAQNKPPHSFRELFHVLKQLERPLDRPDDHQEAE